MITSSFFVSSAALLLLLGPSCLHAHFPFTPVHSLAHLQWRHCCARVSVLKHVFARLVTCCCSLCFVQPLVFVFGGGISMANPQLQHYPAHWWTSPAWRNWRVCRCINLSLGFSCAFFFQTHFLSTLTFLRSKRSFIPTKHHHPTLLAF